MANSRKLQTEIDRVMKKVDEGVELFDEIWEKVYSAEQQNQKEKYEMDLKKEIKKLQRLRDQIKTWISSSEVKDKDPLIDARKLIETKMEQFKICEKETKTKTYSKEGLARQEKLDPQEQAKQDTNTWITEIIEKLTQLVEDREVEIERLSSGKGKKTNKATIEEYIHFITCHKYHINKLEGIMRLVNNDVLDMDIVNPIHEDLEYYLEAYEDLDYQQGYDEEFFYEALNLEEIGVVNVDRVTNIDTKPSKKGKDDDAASASTKGSKDKKNSKKNALSSVIPLTIGRARKSSGKGGKEDEKEELTPTKRVSSGGSVGPTPTTIPAVAAARPAAPPAGGASMAAILKRETEQQEKERQKARAAEQVRQQQLAQQQLLQRQQQEAQLRQQQEALRVQQQRQEAAAAKQKAMQQQEVLRLQQAQQQEALKRQQAAQQQALQQQAQTPEKKPQLQSQTSQGSTGSGVAGLDLLTSGLGGLNLAAGENGAAPDGTYLSALNDSFATMPSSADSERARSYTPQNPYPTPASYPSQPSPIFENPAVFEKLGTDCLFFIFYYAQGSYQQYLAARELKKQSWRFHKKYMTWFQRHEEPKVTTDEYEQGTYVYFDYETGWCTRIKQDFRFEYSFLEDSLQ